MGGSAGTTRRGRQGMLRDPGAVAPSPTATARWLLPCLRDEQDFTGLINRDEKTLFASFD